VELGADPVGLRVSLVTDEATGSKPSNLAVAGFWIIFAVSCQQLTGIPSPDLLSEGSKHPQDYPLSI